MNINDKIWLLLNKKEPKFIGMPYLSFFIVGGIYGMVLVVSIALLFSPGWFLGVFGVILLLISVLSIIRSDFRNGYIHVLYTHSVKLWHEKRKKMGVEK